MRSPAVSVILPTYNRAAMLPGAMASVLSQSFTNLELIVVDDGSDDGTEAVVQGMADERVVYLRRARNGGVAAARNTGIQAARGRLIAFQDSDDEWVQEKLRLQVESLNGRNEHAFSIGTVLRRFGPGVRRWSAPPAPSGPSWAWAEAVAYCQALLVPTALLRKVDGFDETLRLWEDWDLLLRLLQHGAAVACDQSWVVSTRQTDSLTQNHASYAEQQGRVIDKHRKLLSSDSRRLAQLEYVTARYAMGSGHYHHAIRRLRNCLETRPANPRAAALLAIAIGHQALDRLQR